MNAGNVDLLMIIGGNPVYDAPQDLHFADAMDKVALRVQHSLYHDETTDHCHWHINSTHYLEQWGDARAIDGTVSLIQPLIAPLYDGRSEYEFIQGNHRPACRHRLRHRAEVLAGADEELDFDEDWRKALYNGFIPNTAAAVKNGFGEGLVAPPAVRSRFPATGLR